MRRTTNQRAGLSWARTTLVLVLAFVFVFSAAVFTDQAQAFKENEFKTCSLSSFCERLRSDKADDASYALAPETLSLDPSGVLRGKISVTQRERSVADALMGGSQNATKVGKPYYSEIDFAVIAYSTGVVRLKISQPERFEVPEVLLEDLDQVPLVSHSKSEEEEILHFNSAQLVVKFNPVKLVIYSDKTHTAVPTVVFNENNLFKFERQQVPDSALPNEWSETFLSHGDSRKKGPMGLSVDVHFPGVQNVFGIPERATAFSLAPTKVMQPGGEYLLKEPYRLYNLDVFEYLHDHPFGLYGSIPYLTAHKAGATSGAFWLNAAEMYVDIWKNDEGTSTQWVSESGIIDLFFFLGPEPKDVASQYASMTGTTQMPQLFSLGYHQCRWNYKDEEDVAAVDSKFDHHGIPCDVIWLDIEHTDGKRYMTWDKSHFPTPEKMQQSLADKGRRMVTIVDPHIKKDDSYSIFKAAKSKGYFVKKHDETDFDGWCWPGSSMYLDMLNPEIRKWWSTLFTPQVYKGSTESLYIWNDMNEPSVFNGPEITMQKDNIHFNNTEHRDVHNIYGYLYHKATADGLVYRGEKSSVKKSDRPFVLSRAFFSGTQRVGPIWTGDNTADWDHLRVSIPMCLTLGVSGLTFSGADVGGFFGNPDAELLTRWYQLGIFYPFFRAHAHIDTKRREPWVFGDEVMSDIKAAIQLRYNLMPYTYTLFSESHKDGSPVMRPIWYEFPEEREAFDSQEQFLFGSSLLITPVLRQGATKHAMFLPGKGLWYDLFSDQVYDGAKKDRVSYHINMQSIPVSVRGGSIIPRRMRPRRNTEAMKKDPYTLLVVLDKKYEAQGSLYVDDGSSYEYEKNRKYLTSKLSFENFALENDVGHNNMFFSNHPAKVERIEIRGLPRRPTKVDGGRLPIQSPSTTQMPSGLWKLVIHKTPVAMTENWTIKVTL
jgi:alpha 1,3-glucosidase